MSTHDYALDNGTGLAVRTDLNNALLAIVSKNSSATAPSTTYAYMWWADTTTGLLKIRNAANSAWITVGTLATAYLGAMPTTGGTFSAAIDFSNTDYMKIPVGTTAQRPASPASGHIRYNTDLKTFEIYQESVWINLGDKEPFAAKTTTYSVLLSDSVLTADTTSAAFTMTVPTAVGIAGKKFTFKKINSTANALTIATTSSQTIDGATTFELMNQWSSVTIMSDGANWVVVRLVHGIPISGSTVGVGGYGLSSSCGIFTTTSATFVDVTNLSVTIKTRGRPVIIQLVQDGSAATESDSGYIGAVNSTSNEAQAYIKILRDSTAICMQLFESMGITSSTNTTLKIPVGSVLIYDFPAAGTYTYKMQTRKGAVTGSFSSQFNNVKLLVRELY